MRAIAIQGLARRLLRHEAGASQDPEPLREGAERVADKLRAHLSRRIGREGFRTLLARALTLAAAQFPHLAAVHVGADGALIGLRRAVGAAPPDAGGGETALDTADGVAALVAHFLALLITFIGEDLTLRILGAVWPELAWDDPNGWENERP